jgi:hypothetical protein
MATPFAGVQVSSLYRHKVGAFEITVLSDGNIALEATLFSGDQARAEKLLEAAFLPKVVIPTAVNEWLINTGEKLILVDTGASNLPPYIGPLISEPRRRWGRPERGRRHCDHAHAPGSCAGTACG